MHNNQISKHVTLALSTISILTLSACGSDPVQVVTPPSAPVIPVVTPAPVLPAFDPDGELSADIRWTEYGVPHITADNVESMAFGVG